MGVILATTTESMRSELSKDLEPGEELVAFAYGLSMPSKATSDKILRRGLYVFGAIALYFLRADFGFFQRRGRRLRLAKRQAREQQAADGEDESENNHWHRAHGRNQDFGAGL